MDQEFWYGLVFGFGVLVLGTIILIVILIQGGSFQRARMARREQAAERELLERYEDLAGRTTRNQDSVRAELSEIRDRLAEVERMLREVE